MTRRLMTAFALVSLAVLCFHAPPSGAAAADQEAYQKARNDAWTGIMAEFSQKIADDKVDEAIRFIEGYAGPFAAETLVSRSELAQAWRKKLTMFRDTQERTTGQPVVKRRTETAVEKAARLAAARKATAQVMLAVLLDEVANSVLNADFPSAQTRLTFAREDSSFAPVSDEVAALRQIVDGSADLPGAMQQSFEKQIGQEITVQLRRGREAGGITRATGGSVYLRKTVYGGSIESSFKLSELAPQEILARLGTEKSPERAIMRGLVALQYLRSEEQARAYFEQGDCPLCLALSATIEKRQQALIDGKALNALNEVFKLAGLDPAQTNTGKLVDALQIKNYGSNELAKIHAAADDFEKKYGDTRPARAMTEVLTGLKALANGETPPVKLKEANVEVIEEALARLKQANPQQKEWKPKYEFRDDGIKLDLCDHLNLCDIRALAGLPLTELTIRKTRVADISPLMGMSLRYLEINGTLVRDLSPLKGMPLRYLEINETLVRDLSPLKGMPLRHFSTRKTPLRNLADLTLLADAPLESLDIGGVPLTTADFQFLQRFASLKRLSIGNTKLPNLAGLRGLKLDYLSITDTPLSTSDLAVLSGMECSTIVLYKASLTNLKPLRGLRSKSLVLGCNPDITDVTPLAEMSLVGLDISGSSVIYLAPLKGMPLESLRIIDCSELRDLEKLPDYFPDLTRLDIRPEQIRHPEFLLKFRNLATIRNETRQEMGPEAFIKKYFPSAAKAARGVAEKDAR